MGLYENINTKKIDIFSELFMTDNSSNKKNTENFQTESMVHKLKTIKKRKKKQLNNFKNIEELQNIHEGFDINQEKDQEKDKEKEKPIIEGYQQYAYEKYSQHDIYKKNCDPNLYDGCDSVNENKNNADDPRAKIIGAINKAFKFVDEKTYLLADTIRKALSFEQFNKKKIPPKWLRDFETKRKEIGYQADKIGKGISEKERKKAQEADLQLKAYALGIDPKDATPEKLNELKFTIQSEGSDTLILKKYISWFLSIIVSCFAVYNWFFVMYFKDNDGKRVELIDITRKRLYQAKKNNYFLKLIYMFFQFAMFIPEKFELYFVKNIPDMFSKIMNPSFCFIILFFTLIYFLNNTLGMAKMFIVDSIMLDLRNFIVAGLNTAIVFLFGIHMVSFEFYFDVPWIIQEYQRIAVMSTIGMFFMIFFRILHFVIILFISVPVGGVLLMLYVLFNSFFSILYHRLFNDAFKDKTYYGIFEEINDFILKTNKMKTDCDNPSIFDKFAQIINYVSDIFCKYSFHFAFLYMLVYSIIDYMSNIKAPLLKTSLLCINSMLILIFSVLSVSTYMKNNENKLKNGETDTKAKETLSDDRINQYKSKVEQEINEATNQVREPSAPPLETMKTDDVLVEPSAPTIDLLNGISGSAGIANLSGVDTFTKLPAARLLGENLPIAKSLSKVPVAGEIPKVPVVKKSSTGYGLPSVKTNFIPEISSFFM